MLREENNTIAIGATVFKNKDRHVPEVFQR
jgi:hypothetical protein